MSHICGTRWRRELQIVNFMIFLPLGGMQIYMNLFYNTSSVDYDKLLIKAVFKELNEIFFFFCSFYDIIRKQKIKWKHSKLSMSAYINMLIEPIFSVFWNMNVLFVECLFFRYMYKFCCSPRR